MSISAPRIIPIPRTSTGQGHADYTYDIKYGIRDYRGGGRPVRARDRHAGRCRRHCAQDRSPTRGAGALIQMGEHKIDRAPMESGTKSTAIRSSVRTSRCPKLLESYLDDVRKRGSSIGAVIEVVAEGVPAGLGAPIYGKLDGDLAAALMGINAVKAIEIGSRLCRRGAQRRGECRRDAHGKRRQAGVLSGIARAVEVLKAAGALLMFPEGSRMHDGELHPARPGVGMMAVQRRRPDRAVLHLRQQPAGQVVVPRRAVRISFGPARHWRELAGGRRPQPGRALYQRVGRCGDARDRDLRNEQRESASRGAA